MLDYLINLDLGTSASLAGLLISVVGLIVTCVTLRTARRIKNLLFERKRLPEILSKLRTQNSALNAALDQGDFASRDVRGVALEIRATLSHLKGRWKSSELPPAVAHAKRLKKASFLSQESLDQLYGLVSAVTVSLEESIKDNELDVTK